MELTLLLAGLGIIAGVLSGMLGIGGGIVMAPLLLYVPLLFSLGPLSMHTVAGLTIVQGLLACITGALTHHRFKMVSAKLTLVMGASIFMAALLGAAGSGFVSNQILLFLFAFLALGAALLMFKPVKKDSQKPDAGQLEFSRRRALAAASGVGLLGGLVGQGGSFILIPLMTSFVKVPTRIAIGSNLAIVLLSTAAGFIGKALTGQIVWTLALPIALTVVPATYLGSLLSQRVSVAGLRKLLAVLIGFAAIWIWASVLF